MRTSFETNLHVAYDQKHIILLSGFEKTTCGLVIAARDRLEEAVKKHRDAVAVGYVSGKWVPAA